METLWLAQDNLELVPEEIRAYTTSAFKFEADGELIAYVGFMRLNLFDPPYVWLQIKNRKGFPLRAVQWAFRELLSWLRLSTVYAEVDADNKVNQRFANFLGFTVKEKFPDRILLSFEV